MSSAALRVVIADDSADLRDVTQAALERAGLDVVGAAADGDRAVELARDLRPEAVVLDVSMAGPPIAELIEQIRSLPAVPSIVLYSGWPVAELAGLGVAVVRKSADPGALADGVIAAVSEAQGA